MKAGLGLWVMFVLLALLLLSGCKTDLQDLEQAVAELRQQAETLSPSAAIAAGQPLRLPERISQSPFFDRLAANGSQGGAPESVSRPRFAANSDFCAPTALEFRGWIRDAGRMRAWIACPGEPVRAVARGETLNADGAWVASISPEELWLYPGADSRFGESMLLVIPFHGKVTP